MTWFGACSSSPSAPTAPTTVTPPVTVTRPDPPSLTCPGPITTTAASTIAGASVTYAEPARQNGEGSVSVTCAPASGTRFAVGSTQVECVATDSLSRTGTCSFGVTVAAPPRLRRTRIMAFGDSITEGAIYDPNGGEFTDLIPTPATAYPTVLQQLLSARYTDQTITVSNVGKSNEQAERALSRFVFELGKAQPDVVVLMEGYNDLYRADVPALGTEAAERGISQMAAETRHAGVRTFICTLAPSKAGRRRIPMSLIQVTNDRLRAVARGEGAAIIDVFSALLPDVDANVSSDGLHLTPLGYRRVAEAVFAALRDDLEVK